MQLLNKSVESFSNAKYVIANLNKAINTSYIPDGDNINEVIVNFTKIQLSRSFSDGYGQADLEMTFNEKHLLISYCSTSGTTVNTWYHFNDDMQVTKIEFSLWLGDDRAIPGRCHYETLTREFYQYGFIKTDWTTKTAEIVIPSELDKLNPDLDMSELIPNWVYEQQSNYLAVWNPNTVVKDLGKLGYTPVTSIGFKATYHNPDHYYQYVVVYQRYNECENNYYLLNHANDKMNLNDGGLSYKRLLELLEKNKDKEQRRSRRSQRTLIADVETEEQEYEDVNYDEIN